MSPNDSSLSCSLPVFVVKPSRKITAFPKWFPKGLTGRTEYLPCKIRNWPHPVDERVPVFALDGYFLSNPVALHEEDGISTIYYDYFKEFSSYQA